MNIVRTYVDKSKINGLGLFAAADIPKGALIWRVDGLDQVLTEEELDKRHLTIEQKQYFFKYSFKANGRYTFCSDDNKYCNHSDTPNTMSDYKTQVAIKDIKKGEEITCNYNEFVEDFNGY